MADEMFASQSIGEYITVYGATLYIRFHQSLIQLRF